MTMTNKETSLNSEESGHNERLVVAVRIRPTPHISEANRVVRPINEKTLLFTDNPPTPETYKPSFSYSHSDPETGSSPFFPSKTSSGNNRNLYSRSNDFPQTGKAYDFDHVFPEFATQGDVYRATTEPLIPSVFEGFCATVFAYGATSSGKTYTMVGTPGEPGIMSRAVQDIFKLAASNEITNCEVFVSYLEIYNEKIRDLLRPVPGLTLDIREDFEQVHVSGLSEIRAKNSEEVEVLLEKGNKARTMEPTAANVASSRSHAVLLISVRQRKDEAAWTDGKLYLIDLAGSERASQTKNSGLRLREGGHINRSLLALGNCITALAAGDDKFVNYRDSKLTRLLKAALGGPSKTVMIAHVSPSAHQREETRSTLQYGQRARAISNRVRKFIYPGLPSETGVIIEELKNEVRRLQGKLELERGKGHHAHSGGRSSGLPRNPGIPANFSGKNPFYHEGYLDRRGKDELGQIKYEINTLFQQEFSLRNELLRLDGAMLQSALDGEILRLMVLDWEALNSNSGNLTVRDIDMESLSPEEPSSEILSVMRELKDVREEQDKLVHARAKSERELKDVRNRIAKFEQDAVQFLPEIQREILALLCKLQQEQLQKMSVEIEAELKRRGTLLLRCLRQKALGEAIIYRNRSSLSDRGFLPRLKANPGAYSLGPSGKSGAFSPLSSSPISEEGVIVGLPQIPEKVPSTTKYSDFVKKKNNVYRDRVATSSTSDEDLEDGGRFKGVKGSPRKTYKPRAGY